MFLCILNIINKQIKKFIEYIISKPNTFYISISVFTVSPFFTTWSEDIFVWIMKIPSYIHKKNRNLIICVWVTSLLCMICSDTFYPAPSNNSLRSRMVILVKFTQAAYSLSLLLIVLLSLMKRTYINSYLFNSNPRYE